MNLPKYSMGIGDRFAHQGKAQLAAFVKAKELGVDVTPVWNKSNREHLIVHSEPASVRAEADAAVKALGWAGRYFVDADHIGLKTVDGFIASSDFFTIDVADFIGKPAGDDDIGIFVDAHANYTGSLSVPGIDDALDVTSERIEAIARKYLFAVKEAGKVYRHIEAAKGAEICRRSFDGRNRPAADAARAAVHPGGHRARKYSRADDRAEIHRPVQQGRRLCRRSEQFEREFNDDLAVIDFAVNEFGLADESEAQRPFRQRQVFDLSRDPQSNSPRPARACTSRPPARPGSKS